MRDWLPLGAAAAMGAGVALYLDTLRRRRQCVRDAIVYELKGQYYQELGHAWDHETKDFKVIYRPLYHCEASHGRFEAHVLAASHFSRWEEKFRRVGAADVPPDVRAWLLPGPFTLDLEWRYAWRTSALPAGARTTRSGQPSRRSHEPARLEDVIGDYRGFIDAVHAELRARGLDATARGFEMDHLCYRCESVAEYVQVLDALVPALGTTLVEGMIGGRPIATVALHEPIVHAGYTVPSIEVPCPKAGTSYVSGLEHAEIVVGQPADGVEGNARLLAFMAECEADGSGVQLAFKTQALHKTCNADVCHVFELAEGRKATVKFHARPLHEVVEWEKLHGAVVPVPEGYFEGSVRSSGT